MTGTIWFPFSYFWFKEFQRWAHFDRLRNFNPNFRCHLRYVLSFITNCSRLFVVKFFPISRNKWFKVFPRNILFKKLGDDPFKNLSIFITKLWMLPLWIENGWCVVRINNPQDTFMRTEFLLLMVLNEPAIFKVFELQFMEFPHHSSPFILKLQMAMNQLHLIFFFTFLHMENRWFSKSSSVFLMVPTDFYAALEK